MTNILSRSVFITIRESVIWKKKNIGAGSIDIFWIQCSIRTNVAEGTDSVKAGCGSGARVYADRRMACNDHGFASLSWCGRKTHLLLGQLYTFCLLVCQLLPDIDINALLLSDDKSLTTAHKYKKSRIFQLVHRSFKLVAIRCKPSKTFLSRSQASVYINVRERLTYESTKSV